MRKQEPGHVRGVVDGLIKRWENGAVKKGNAVRDAWFSSIDEKAKGHARPISLKNGVLMIEVENSTWLYKLTLEKNIILKKFNTTYTGRKKAQDIRFRIGAMESR